MSKKINFKHLVIYGGQYGSEGKASAAEFWIKQQNPETTKIVFGENSPNSGHTSSRGSTRNIPASSFWADYIVLGPDSVIDPAVLLSDWEKVGEKTIFIHENAALLTERHKQIENDVVERISSTGSGSGAARIEKQFRRDKSCTVAGYKFPKGIKVLPTEEYINVVEQCRTDFCLFECSQGVLLDVNLGIYPYVTSRSTLPQCAIARNGLSGFEWNYVGVYRTYPIRTRGPSGPTGGAELTWNSLGLQPEITTVTKKPRRIFEFSTADFIKSIKIAPPDIVMFTHLDYLTGSFEEWMNFHQLSELRRFLLYTSSKTGKFEEWCQLG